MKANVCIHVYTGALEEHHSALIRTSSQQKLDLSRSKSRFEEQRKLCLSLQSDYDSLAEQVSDWAEKNSTTTDALVQKIRYHFVLVSLR